MKINVLYFASLRDRHGDQASWELEDGATVGILRARQAIHQDIRAALNEEFVSDTARLADGDELAWIPPVSGG